MATRKQQVFEILNPARLPKARYIILEGDTITTDTGDVITPQELEAMEADKSVLLTKFELIKPPFNNRGNNGE